MLYYVSSRHVFGESNKKCGYSLSIYATEEIVENHKTANGVVYSVIVGSIFFICTALVFLLYDFFVEQRNRKVSSTALRSTAIVESLFPKKVVDPVMQEVGEPTPRAATVEGTSGIQRS